MTEKKDAAKGERLGTTVIGNSLYIREFEKVVEIKTRDGRKIELSREEAGDVALELRGLSHVKLFTEPQLRALKYKIEKGEDALLWLEKVMNDELRYEDY